MTVLVGLLRPFNEAGVVEVPQFVLVRPVGTIGDIKLTVRAHRIRAHQWIAEATWGSDTGHLPFDGRYPSRWTKAFQSRSEAVEDALDVIVRPTPSLPGRPPLTSI